VTNLSFSENVACDDENIFLVIPEKAKAFVRDLAVSSLSVPDIHAAHKFRDDKNNLFLYCSSMRDYNFFVYILASNRNGTLYTGMTNDLIRRTREHKTGYMKGFTDKHRVKTLVWFEHHTDVDYAILREKRIKRWRRGWKLNLIERHNPAWADLTPML